MNLSPKSVFTGKGSNGENITMCSAGERIVEEGKTDLSTSGAFLFLSLPFVFLLRGT